MQWLASGSHPGPPGGPKKRHRGVQQSSKAIEDPTHQSVPAHCGPPTSKLLLHQKEMKLVLLSPGGFFVLFWSSLLLAAEPNSSRYQGFGGLAQSRSSLHMGLEGSRWCYKTATVV